MLDGGYKKKQSEYDGVNLAPVAPLQKLGDDSFERDGFARFARELYMHTRDQNIAARREMWSVGQMMANLRSGKLEMRRDPIVGTLALLKPLPHTTRRDRHVYPIAQVNSSHLTSNWMLSNPRVVVRHFGSTNMAQIQHGLIQSVIDHYASEYFDDLFNARESLSMMDYGTSIIRTDYDDKLNKITQLMPVIEERSRTVFAGWGYCGNCPFEGTPDQFVMDPKPRCPECGSYNIPEMAQPEVVKANEVTGSQEVAQGDIRITLEDVPAINWDLSKMVHESGYVDKAFKISHDYIRSILGVEIASEDPNEHYGLRVMGELGTRGGNVEGYGRDNLDGNTEGEQRRMTVGHETWYRPEEYAGVRFTTDEETVGGVRIPKNVPLEKIFTEGMCLATFNEGNVLIGAYNECCPMKSSVYHIQSHSGVGNGTSAAIEVSEQLSSAHSAALAVVKRYGAGGGHAYDKEALSKKEARLLLKPGGLVGVNVRGKYTQVSQIFHKVETGEINDSNIAMIAQLNNLLNICFQTTDFTQGVTDSSVDVNTLGGQQLLQAQNQQRTAAPLRMKGYHRKIIAESVIDLFRKNIRIPKFFGTNDKFALTKGRMIAGTDLPDTVKCDFVRDSEIASNKLTKRDNTDRMIEKSGLTIADFAMAAQMQPRFLNWYADQYDAELPTANQSEILMRCQDRIDQIAQLADEQDKIAELSGAVNDIPSAAEMIVDQLMPPLDMSEEVHVIKAQVVSEYLDDDQVKEWSQLRRAATSALVLRHYKLDRDFRYSLKAMEAEGEIGVQTMVAQAQMAIAAQQQQQQQQLAAGPEAEQADRALLEQGVERLAGEVEKEQDFARGEESADLAHERALELEQVKQKSQAKSPKK